MELNWSNKTILLDNMSDKFKINNLIRFPTQETHRPKIITYDIETVPQQAPLTPVQEELINNTFNRWWRNEPIEGLTPAEIDNNKKELRKKIMATNPQFGDIVVIGMYFPNEGITASLTTENYTEEELMRWFWDWIRDAELFRSFNGLGFDNKFVALKSMKHGVPVSNQRFMNWRRFQRKPHYDAQALLSDWQRGGFSLKAACEMFDIPSSKEGAVTAKNVAQYIAAGKYDEVEYYCCKDVYSTDALCQKMEKYFNVF